MIRNNSILLRGNVPKNKSSKQYMSAKRMFGSSRGRTPRISSGGGMSSSGSTKASTVGPSDDTEEELLNKLSGNVKMPRTFLKRSKRF